jgi:hypothetical protein
VVLRHGVEDRARGPDADEGGEVARRIRPDGCVRGLRELERGRAGVLRRLLLRDDIRDDARQDRDDGDQDGVPAEERQEGAKV